MTDEIKVQDAGTADKVKLAVAILVVIAGVAGYYLLAGRAAWLRWLPVAGSSRSRRWCWRSRTTAMSFASSWSWRASSCARSCGRAARRPA